MAGRPAAAAAVCCRHPQSHFRLRPSALKLGQADTGEGFISSLVISSALTFQLTELTDISLQQKPSLQPPGLGGVMFSYRDVGVKVHCCSFVFILVCSQQRAVWAGPSCIPGSDSRPPPGRSSPAQPLPSRQCFLRTRSHLLTSDRGFKFLTNTFPETFIVKQSYSQNIFNSNLS